MVDSNSYLRLLAAWALTHEAADEAWKAAVERGEAQDAEVMGQGPEAFAEGLAALVSAEKEQLKAELAAGGALGSNASGAGSDEVAALLGEVRFEIAELRGRIESLQASVDALSEDKGAPGTAS
jgi:hypothetical protein